MVSTTDHPGSAPQTPLIAIVGPCASGKSSLARALRSQGFRVREIAQEHSLVPALWQHFAQPDVLIYLEVSFREALKRRPILQANPDWWDEQLRRLKHARRHAHIVVNTDAFSAEEVVQHVQASLPTSPRPPQRRARLQSRFRALLRRLGCCRFRRLRV